MVVTRSLCLSLLLLGAAVAGELGDEAFFRALEGDWDGKGTLTNAEGEEGIVTEKWSGKFTDDGGFVMEGTRQWGDDTRDFRWVFSFNPTSELFECLYWHEEMEEDLRFEVSLTDAKVEMRAPFGEPGSELLVSNEKTSEGLRGKVKLENGNGTVLLSGELVHVRRQD